MRNMIKMTKIISNLLNEIIYCIGIIVIFMVVKVFISSNQTEFSEERKFLYDEIKNDPYFKHNVELFVFEEDIARPISANEVFLNEVEESDIYIGLIGQNYGNIYEDNISATEYEYNIFITDKHDAYFFIKDCNNRDEGSKNFLNRIQKVNKYKTFTTKEELLSEVKKSLQEYINNRLTHVAYDKQILYNSSIEDVDEEAIELYLDVLENNRIRDLFGKRDLDKILEYIGAGKIDKNGIFHFNKAGALFFTKDISKFDLEHEIKMVRFNGTERLEIIDKHFTESSFLKLIKEFDSFFYQNTKLGGIVTGMKSTTIPEYPIKAVREAFINSIAHRDYLLTGDCITFYIYDDRIEIISPGKLPYPMTIEDLGVHKNPKHRNKNICKIFETTEYMEHVGTGITRMRNEMKKSNLPEPEFEDGFYFKVVLRGPNGNLILPKDATTEDFKEYKLNDRQIDALLKMKNEETKFTYNSYMNQYNISKSTAKRDLKQLEEKKLIRKLMIDKKYYFFV